MCGCKTGFFLVESLVSILLITWFIVFCMRYQARVFSLQTQALDTMKAVELIDAIFEDIKSNNSLPNNSICKFHCSRIVESVTMPAVQSSPPRLSLTPIGRMKVMTVTISWTSQSGQQVCRLPYVFKEDA